MALRSLMPGMLLSKTTACAQLKAACDAEGASGKRAESDTRSGVTLAFVSEGEVSSGGTGGVKRGVISAVTRSMACSRWWICVTCSPSRKRCCSVTLPVNAASNAS